jgi:hypothetical protein
MNRKVIFSICLSAFLISCSQEKQEPKKPGVYDPSAVKTEKIAVWKRFNNQHQNKWKVKWNPITGTPHKISGHYIEIKDSLTKENIEQVTRKQLEKHRDLLQINPKTLNLSKADLDIPKYAEASTGTWYINYRQTYNDLPVRGGSVRLIIRNQKLTSFGSDYYPGIDISPDPKISEEQAVEKVNLYMDQEQPLEPFSSELIILPKVITNGIRYYLSWQITMPVVYISSALLVHKPFSPPGEEQEPEQVPVQWRYFIDAETGNIIERINLMVEADLHGRVSGTIHPRVPADPLMEVPMANMAVNLNILNGRQSLWVETNANGEYIFNGLDAGPANIIISLKGLHVQVRNQDTGDPDPIPEAATHIAQIEVPGRHDWVWSPDEPQPNIAEINAFYHVNWIRDWFLRGDPFDISPDPDPLQVNVRIAGWGNASASADGLRFGTGNLAAGQEDWALCADIIYHEYTHRIVQKIYEDAMVLLPYSGQTGAMNEAWADYFAATTTDNPAHGVGCYQGRNIDIPDRHYPDDWRGLVHTDGLIFSGAIWDTRSFLENDYANDLALRAMKNTPISFSEYLEAMLEEDDDSAHHPPDSTANNDISDGTPNIETICHSFYDLHGIYSAGCIGYTNDPIAAIATPSPTEFNLFDGAVNLIDIVGAAAGALEQPLDHFIIEYSDANTIPPNWQSAGIALTDGGRTVVIDDILASWDLTEIPEGTYNILLTVVDAANNMASRQTKVTISRLLRGGWPQNMENYFITPIAVGNIDPVTPQLEVVAISNGRIYVFHENGSLYEPWPIFVSWGPNSAPAIADLDNDGDFEIVASNPGHVRAWHHDGTRMFTRFFEGRCNNNNFMASPVLWDLDNDGNMEIIAGACDGNLHIVHPELDENDNISNFESGGFTWPKIANGTILATPAIADLDRDGEMEIVVSTSEGNIYAWNLDGSDLAGWPIDIGQPVISSAAIGDIDNDPNHDLEIIVGSDDGNVYAWHHDGRLLDGLWPVDISERSNVIWTSPALTDLDGDGDLEILINGKDDTLKALEHDGSEVMEWRPEFPPLMSSYSPVVGDLDNNNIPEVAIGASNTRVYAYHTNGATVNNFPQLTNGHFLFGSPLITDMDFDGHPEIIAGSRGLYIWNLPNNYNPDVQDWPTFHHDMKRTGNYDLR